MDIEKIIVDRISELLLKEATDSSSPGDKDKKDAPKPDDSNKTRRPPGPAPTAVKDFIRRAQSEPGSLLDELGAKKPSDDNKISGSIKILKSAIENYRHPEGGALLSEVFSDVTEVDSGVKLRLKALPDGNPAVDANYSSRYAAAIVYAAAKLKWIDADPNEVSPQWTGKDSKEVFVKFS
jgi:hypothetical protein